MAPFQHLRRGAKAWQMRRSESIPDIMFYGLGSDNDIGDGQFVYERAGRSSADDQVPGFPIDQVLGLNGELRLSEPSGSHSHR